MPSSPRAAEPRYRTSWTAIGPNGLPLSGQPRELDAPASAWGTGAPLTLAQMQRDAACAVVALLREEPVVKQIRAAKELDADARGHVVGAPSPIDYTELPSFEVAQMRFAKPRVPVKVDSAIASRVRRRSELRLVSSAVTRSLLTSGPPPTEATMSDTSDTPEDTDDVTPRSDTTATDRRGRGGRKFASGQEKWQRTLSEMTEVLGEPAWIGRRQGARFVHWDRGASPNCSNFMAVVRLSGSESTVQDSAVDQLRRTLTKARTEGVHVRHVIFTAENSGRRRKDARADLDFMAAAANAGEIIGVIAPDTSRLVRLGLTREMLYDEMKRIGLRLMFADLGKEVDWADPDDMFQLEVRGLFDSHLPRYVERNTDRGVYESWLQRGRGLPGCMPFGFYMDESTQQWTVDREQWEIIRRAYEIYDEACRAGKPGAAARVYEYLYEEGCGFSEGHVGNILKDSRYFTGEVMAVWRGQPVIGRPVEIPEDLRIPKQLHQRVLRQQLINRGRYGTSTPRGTYLLNAVPFMHSRCMHLRHPGAGRRADGSKKSVVHLIRVPTQKAADRTPKYRHAGHVPVTCPRCAWVPYAIDSAVAQSLRRLARHPEITEAIRQVMRPGTGDTTRPGMGDLAVELKELEDDLRARRARRAQRGSYEHSMSSEQFAKNETNPIEARIAEIKAEIGPGRRSTELPNELEFEDMRRAYELDDPQLAAERERLLARFDEIMTDTTPEDDELRELRVALVINLLSLVIIHDEKDGWFELELRGPLVPPDTEIDGPLDPIATTRSLLSTNYALDDPSVDGTTKTKNGVSPIRWQDLTGIEFDQIGVARHPQDPPRSHSRPPRLRGRGWEWLDSRVENGWIALWIVRGVRVRPDSGLIDLDDPQG